MKTYPTDDTLMTVRDIIDRHFHLLWRTDIRLPDSIRSQHRLPSGEWVIRKWGNPRRSATDKRKLFRVDAHISLIGTEHTIPIKFEPHETLLVKGLPSLKS